jgi:hypothetical protein
VFSVFISAIFTPDTYCISFKQGLHLPPFAILRKDEESHPELVEGQMRKVKSLSYTAEASIAYA